MANRERLLAAAKIVERVDPKWFAMASVDTCILGHCRKQEGFEELHRLLRTRKSYITTGAEFFGITPDQSRSLFEGDRNYTPSSAAKALRAVAGPEPVKARGKAKPKTKTKPKTAKGVKAVKKAISEATRYPTIKEDIAYRIEMVRRRKAADSVLG